MDPQSPFANPHNALPIIGEPKVAGAMLLITIVCPCEGKVPIMGVAGSVYTCTGCQKKWVVNAEVKMNMQIAPVPVVS